MELRALGQANQVHPAPVAKALPKKQPAMARDQLATRPRGLGEQPQAKFGVVLTPVMEPHAAGLARFEADCAAKIDQLAAQLKADPAYQRAAAPGAWVKLSANERLALAEHVAQLQGQLFGFRPAKAHLIWERDRDSDGGFDDEAGRLDLNRNATAFADLGQFLNTVVHEQFHCYQHALTRQAFPADDPRQAASQVYQLNEKDYHEAPDSSKRQPTQYARYRAQPSEAHAFMMGQRLYQQLFGA